MSVERLARATTRLSVVGFQWLNLPPMPPQPSEINAKHTGAWTLDAREINGIEIPSECRISTRVLQFARYLLPEEAE